jgi:hypothetical protein
MIQPERKVVTKLYLREISGVTTPAQSGAVVAIMKSAQSVAATPAPVAPKMTPEGEAAIAKILATIRGETITKSQHEENRPMSHFETLLKSRTEKFGETQSEAFKKLLDDPENSGLADAYARDEQDDAKRLREAQARVDY